MKFIAYDINPVTTEEEIAEHLAILASDEFGGRAPSSPGEELTVNYIAEQFEAAGLRPGAGGSFATQFRSTAPTCPSRGKKFTNCSTIRSAESSNWCRGCCID